MKKLFKEVWKSFAKSKVILAGLIILIFLTSGIITLIFDVVNAYQTQYNVYKQKSVLQDVTMNTSLNLYGSTPNSIYYDPEKQNENNKTIYNDENYIPENWWIYHEPKNSYIDFIQINSQSDFIRLNDLVDSNLFNSNVYVKTKDLSTLLNTYLSMGKIPNPTGETDIELVLDNSGNNQMNLYDSANEESIRNAASSIKEIKDTYNSGTWTSSGNAINLFKSSNIFTTQLDDIVVDLTNGDAYFKSKLQNSKSEELKKYQQNKELFFDIDSSIVESWLGFVDGKLDASSDWILEGSIPQDWNGISLRDLYKKTLPKIKLPIDVSDIITGGIILSKIKIKSQWLVYSQYDHIYIKHTRRLEDVNYENGQYSIGNSWTGYFKEYLEKIKNTELQTFYETNYWTKALVINKVDYQGNKISLTDENGDSVDEDSSTIFKKVIMTVDDLNYSLYDKYNNDINKTLAELANVSVNENSVNKMSTDLSSSNAELIKSNAKEFKYNQVYSAIKELTSQIGIRETLTVNSNEEQGTNVFHFINLGNEKNELNWNGINIKQEVGKLVSTQSDSSIFNYPSNIKATSSEVPINYVTDIVEQLLKGLSPNRDYLNPMISFNGFTYESNGTSNTISSSKIVWMSKDGASDDNAKRNVYGIARNGVQYFILKTNIKDPESIWNCVAIMNSKEDLDKYIKINNLNFAPFDLNGNSLKVVSEKGWARQDNNYSDKYSVPFQYYLPNSDLIKDFNNNDPANGKYGMEAFRDNLINSLTLSIRPLIPASLWAILMDGVNTAFSMYGFGAGLTPPAAISNATIIKIVLGVFHDAIVASNEDFTKPLLSNLLDGIKRTINPNGNASLEEQKKNLKHQISNISKILWLTTGMNFSPDIIDEIVVDPSLLIDGLKQLISSINLDVAILEIWNNFYGENGELESPNKILGTGDMIPYIYKNIYSFDFLKEGLKNILKSTTFGNQKAADLIIPLLPPELSSMAGLISIALGNKKVFEMVDSISFENQSNGFKTLKENSDILTDTTFGKELKSNSVKIKEGIFSLISIKISIINLKLSDLPITVDEYATFTYDPAQNNPLELDMDLIWYLNNYVFVDDQDSRSKAKKLEIFGIDPAYFLSYATTSFIEVKDDYNQITMEENIGKLAIVNDAYLKQNNKEVYRGTLTNEVINEATSGNELENKKYEKYTIKIENVRYLIVNNDFSVDYMYPVINSENMTVNTKTQALVYVNQYGFDHIKRSNQSAPYQKYFLFKTKNGQSPVELQTQLNKLVYKLTTNQEWSNSMNVNSKDNIYKLAYLASESSLLNPERSLRLTIIDDMLKNLEFARQIIGIMLCVIVAIVLAFVVRRYIGSRSKVLGILKAQGYSSWQIALSICLFPLFASVIGAILGYVVGLVAQFGIFDLFSLFWTLPNPLIVFNWLTFALTLVIPIVLLCLLTIIITFWFLYKNKSMAMMNGSMEVVDNSFANSIRKSVRKTSVKNRFSISLALGSVGKLIALFISALFTAGITLFFVTSFKTFNQSISRTYAYKNYNYMISYTSPTIEGGNIKTYSLIPRNNSVADLTINNINSNFEVFSSLENMLYVPVGDPSEGYVYYADYFKPGFNYIINKDGANGSLSPTDTETPHIFTKSSIDMTVEAGGLSINVWKNLYNAIPESQRISIISKSQKASKWLEWTQEGQIYELDGKQYITRFFKDNTNKIAGLGLWNDETKSFLTTLDDGESKTYCLDYFVYNEDEVNPENSEFRYRDVNSYNSGYIDPELATKNKKGESLLITGSDKSNFIRSKYRDFLVRAYDLMLTYSPSLSNPSESKLDPNLRSPMPEYVLDYFIFPGGMFLAYDNATNKLDETFTYIDTTNVNNLNMQPKINGYKENSQYVQIKDEKGNNLIKLANNFNEPDLYPLIINKVISQKYGLKKNDILTLKINNQVNRYQNKLAKELQNIDSSFVGETNSNEVLKFKIIGINDTYINDEWTTSQEAANKILGLDNNSYNGILSNSTEPFSLASSLPLYSYNGYWSADSTIFNPSSNINNLSASEIQKIIKTYREIFFKTKPDDASKENISLVAQSIRRIKNNYSNNEINNLIRKWIGLDNLDIDYIENESNLAAASQANNAIQKFIKIYTDNALYSFLDSAVSNGVEKEYIENASSTINETLLIMMAITFIISLTVLIMITSMIINENERNIAIFGILGFTTREKIIMFFSIYVPIVILSMAVAAFIVWLVIPAFLSTILSTTSILLPMSLTITHVLIASGVLLFVFAITCMILWIVQGRINPTMLLKEV